MDFIKNLGLSSVLVLPIHNDFVNKLAIVTGSGVDTLRSQPFYHMNDLVFEGANSGQLNYAKAKILSNDRCRNLRPRAAKDQFCAQVQYFDDKFFFPIPNHGICYGDIGGPLVMMDDKNFIGIVTKVSSRCHEGLGETGLYTNVHLHYDFIENSMQDRYIEGSMIKHVYHRQ